MTLRRFVAVLVDAGVVSEGVGEAYRDALEQLSFAGRGSPSSAQSQAIARFEREVRARAERGDSEIEAARVRLAPVPRPTEVVGELRRESGADRQVRGIPLDLEAELDAEWGDHDAAAETRKSAAPRGVAARFARMSRRQRGALVLSGVVVWSLVTIGLGVVAAEPIRSSLVELAAFVFQRPLPTRTVERQLEQLRRRAGERPDDFGLWLRYSELAQAQRHEVEAVHALRHVVARRPDDAQALNALAWLLLTARAAHARDPVEALVLAERAHALDQSPAITDTLAEAAFQNGDPQRAVALEQDALRRVEGNDGFYRDQLDRFTRAVAARAEAQ